MKKLQYSFMCLLALGLASCAKDDMGMVEPAKPEVPYMMQGDVVDGWIRIKLSEDAVQPQTGAFTRGEANTGNVDLDRIAQKLGATEVRPVFNVGGKYEARHRKYGLHLWYDVKFDETVPVSRAASEFEDMSDIEVVEPIYRAYITDDLVSVPREIIYMPSNVVLSSDDATAPFNDPMLAQQWHYHNDGSISGTVAGADINLFEAWKVEAGKPEVIVSVHDEGIQIDHPDLADHIWVNPTPGQEGVDDYYNDVNGWCFVYNQPEITVDTHGTHVSGTIAAVNNNGIGVCGVAGGTGVGDGARIMSCQIIDGANNTLFASDNNICNSYIYAADHGAVISQNSWTIGSTAGMPQSYGVAFEYFNENAGMDDTDGDGENDRQTGPMAGGLIMFAAGNAGGPTLLPAADDRVIAVAAMAPTYQLGTYSSHGEDIDILAPGGGGSNYSNSLQILSTYAVDSYASIYGTSMACPHVSGVAALIVSHFGKEGFTAEECKKRLLESCRPMGGLIPASDLGSVGYGLVDAAAALMDDPKAAPASVTEMSAEANKNIVTVTWVVPADANDCAVFDYVVTFTPEDGGEPIVQEVRNLYGAGDKVSYDITVGYNKVYSVAVVARDRWGNVSAETELAGTIATENFVNSAPRLLQQIPSMTIEEAGEANMQQVDLGNYIYDSNVKDGDVLTYTIKVGNAQVAVVTEAEGILYVNPRSKGTTSVAIVATDIAGASVETSFNVSVLSGSAPIPDASGVVLDMNPVEDILGFSVSGASAATVEITIFDAAARTAAKESVALDNSGKGEITVQTLAPGLYTLRINYNGQLLNTTFVKK